MKADSTSEPDPRDAAALYDETILNSPELIDAQRVVLHAERILPMKTFVRGQLATITRRAVTERRQIEIDVTHEELVVTYEPGDLTEMDGPQRDRFSVLLHAEEVVVTKNIRVVEEVFISTQSVTEVRKLKGAVQHEVLDIQKTL